jgi:phosphoesterase RecJ-like protein
MKKDKRMIDAALTEGIRRAADVLCVSHVSPDGDAVGSLLGMGHILRSLGKRPTLALQDDVPDQLQFLPAAADVVHSAGVGAAYDLIICLDASSPDRMGNVYRPEDHAEIPLFVVDHHITNTLFGTLNWVAPDCAATCQMLLYLADALEIPVAGDLAECLLTGLVTDTLCFRTSNTDTRVLEAAMRLMAGGADLAAITQQTLNRRPLSILKLWGVGLSDAQLEDGIIWTVITKDQLEIIGYPSSDTQISSTLITAAEADISASFMEIEDDSGVPAVECSFRAKPGFDVSSVAFQLGGGGHPAAAGCTIYGSSNDVVGDVVALLKQARAAAMDNQA